MNTDVEELLRDGMERFTAEVRAPAGLARTAERLHRRRLHRPRRGGGGTVAVTAAAVVAVIVGPRRSGPDWPRRGPGAHGRVRDQPGREALAGQHLVSAARTQNSGVGDRPITGPTWGPPGTGFEEFTGSDCGHALSNGTLHPPWRIRALLDGGTALIGGKLTERLRLVLQPQVEPAAGGAHAGERVLQDGRARDGRPLVPTSHWPAFIRATLACGAATVTGHVQIDGVETTKITGSPVTIRLPPGEARAVREKWTTVPVDRVREPRDVSPGAAGRLERRHMAAGGLAPPRR